MAPNLLARSSVNVTTSTIPRALYIAGFTIAGFLVVASASWFALRYFRRRLEEKCTGVAPEMDEPVNHILGVHTANVVFPRKAIAPTFPIVTPSRHDDPPSSQVHASPSPRRPRALSGLNPAHPRHSHASSSHSPSSPRLNSRNSFRSSSSFQARPVRQLFQPVLPDELTLSRMGEHLLVLQSFDDGWCLAARDNSHNSRSSLSLFNPSRHSARVESGGEYAGLGFVPAWVFVRPMKGMRVERPIRSSSAGLPQAGGRTQPRDSGVSGVSWANFGT